MLSSCNPDQWQVFKLSSLPTQPSPYISTTHFKLILKSDYSNKIKRRTKRATSSKSILVHLYNHPIPSSPHCPPLLEMVCCEDSKIDNPNTIISIPSHQRDSTASDLSNSTNRSSSLHSNTTSNPNSSRPSSVASTESHSSNSLPDFIKSNSHSHSHSPTFLAVGSGSGSSSGMSRSTSPAPNHHLMNSNSTITSRRSNLPNPNARRPSLPIIPSMNSNRTSTVSIQSFESLPEGETLNDFNAVLSLSSSNGGNSQRKTSPNRSNMGPPPSRKSSKSPDPIIHPNLSESPTTTNSTLSTTSTSTNQTSNHHSPLLSSHSMSRNSSTSNSRQGLKRSSTDPIGTSNSQLRKTQLERRRHVALELLETERVFVKSLKVINEVSTRRRGGAKTRPRC